MRVGECVNMIFVIAVGMTVVPAAGETVVIVVDMTVVIAVCATEGPTIGLSERLTAGATEGVIGNFGEGEKDGEAPDKMAALGRKMPEAAEYSVVTENMYELVLRKTEM